MRSDTWQDLMVVGRGYWTVVLLEIEGAHANLWLIDSVDGVVVLLISSGRHSNSWRVTGGYVSDRF